MVFPNGFRLAFPTDARRAQACVGQAGPLTALRTLRLFRAGQLRSLDVDGCSTEHGHYHLLFLMGY